MPAGAQEPVQEIGSSGISANDGSVGISGDGDDSSGRGDGIRGSSDREDGIPGISMDDGISGIRNGNGSSGQEDGIYGSVKGEFIWILWRGLRMLMTEIQTRAEELLCMCCNYVGIVSVLPGDICNGVTK